MLRHSTAHLLAQAVQRLFPGAQVTIGPVIDERLLLRLRLRAAVHRRGPGEDRGGDAEDRQGSAPGLAQRQVARRGGGLLQGHGRALQGGDHRIHSCRRRPVAVLAGRVHRPVPRPARALHRQAARLQADEGSRRLLARRFQQRDAQPHLRHLLVERQGPQGAPVPDRGGREARPPQDRQGARPVPPAGGSAGHGVLAPEGLGAVAGGRAVHAPGVPGFRLPGSALPADPRCVAVEEVRTLGQLPGEHVLHRVRKAHLCGEADELPGPRADLQPRPAQLPRPADPLRRVRRLPPQRAERRAARDHARARLHPGRRPHLLHRSRRSSRRWRPSTGRPWPCMRSSASAISR